MAVALATAPARSESIFEGSKVTSQLAGLPAVRSMSFNVDDPVLRITSSSRLVSPAVMSELSKPCGVVSSIWKDPVMTISSCNSAEVEPDAARTGI